MRGTICISNRELLQEPRYACYGFRKYDHKAAKKADAITGSAAPAQGPLDAEAQDSRSAFLQSKASASPTRISMAQPYEGRAGDLRKSTSTLSLLPSLSSGLWVG